jgi:peptide subunit release factor 1 (eRF1)
MITREDIRELARFTVEEPATCAVSFYFQPRTPQNRSHKEEAILAKELVKNALREAEKNGKSGSLRSDLDRVLQLAEGLHGNQARAKAVFACGSRKFWREFDLPWLPTGTQLFVNQQFHLRPLAQLLGAQPAVWVAVVDRQKARFFDLRLDELSEREGLFRIPPVRQGSSDGYGGYEGGRAQRRVEDEALHHYKEVAAHLQQAFEKGWFEKLIVGCQDVNWRDLGDQLHPYVKQRLLGRFSAEAGKINNEQVREQASRVLREWQENRRQGLVKEVLDQALSNSRGVTGLRRVLRSLELGEVQTLLIGDNFKRAAAGCPSCKHLDPHPVQKCPACGHEAREIEDICDAIIPIAIRRDIELFYVKDDPKFDAAGDIAALLRFRADQNANAGLRAAS